MKVHILRTGTLQGELAWLLLKAGTTLMDKNHRYEPRVWANMPTHAVLIEHPEGRILWDTGVPRNWETQWEPAGFQDYFPVAEDVDAPEGWLDSGLALLELTPDDIDVLVLSHLHYDHVGNARMFDNGKTRIIANNDEIAGVKTLSGIVNGAHLMSEFEGLPIHGTPGDEELVPGVHLINTPGHTWGTMSLQIDLPNDGTKIFTSDALYLSESYGPPAVGSAIVWDNVKWLESVEKIRSIADRTGAELIFGHDDHQLPSLRTAPNGFYY
ncbi:MAG: N-acyl homoserine lactonase [Microbacterium sp.]|jgi:glyoxylase-like metal-dependent hydrolase (beta-lactamase superfamily II)|nr:N-acyl homoserine lactonase [Microbacterium sp.]